MTIDGALLVGSVPLDNAETVFRAVAGALGADLMRLPDGETGVRKDWIAWQYEVLAHTPGLEPIPVGDRGYLRRQLVRLKERVPPRFGSLGYADAAIASFAIFDRLQRQGSLPATLRFSVSLPTPLAPVTVFVDPGDRALVEPAYEAALLGELGRIMAEIPHERLAIQWDVAVEVGLIEGAWPAHFEDVERQLHTRLVRLGASVPADVELGYHLCYGDFGHRHFKNPADASVLVALARALISRIAMIRPLTWLHLPVPITWDTPAAFAPLANLDLPASTELYLGLIHRTDGRDGALRRIALARDVSRFGIATECGWGRRPADTIPELLALHAEVLSICHDRARRPAP